MTATTTTIHDVWIYTKQRRRKPDVFDLVLSVDGIVVERPGRTRQRMGWDRISEWEIEERQGYVLLTLRGGGSTTRLVVTGWSASGLGSALEEAKAGSTGDPRPTATTASKASAAGKISVGTKAVKSGPSSPTPAAVKATTPAAVKATKPGGTATTGTSARTPSTARVSGSKVTGSKVTGSKVTGSKVTGSKVTGSKVTGSKVAKSSRDQVGAPARTRTAGTEIPEATAVAVARTAGKLEEFEVIETDEAADVLAVADTVEAPRTAPSPAGDAPPRAGGGEAVAGAEDHAESDAESDGDLADVVGLEPMTWTQLPWKPIVTAVLLGVLAFAVIVVLLQSAGIIDWGFLGPTA